MIKYYKSYFKYYIKHKYYVAVECFKRKQYWLGIVHDISKLYPSELKHSVYWFNSPMGINHNYPPSIMSDEHIKLSTNYDYAWLHHQKRNKHHWQYWVLQEDEGKMKLLDIPMKYRIEMLCDWIGANKACKNPKSVYQWYMDNKNIILINKKTKNWIIKELLKIQNRENC